MKTEAEILNYLISEHQIATDRMKQFKQVYCTEAVREQATIAYRIADTANFIFEDTSSLDEFLQQTTHPLDV